MSPLHGPGGRKIACSVVSLNEAIEIVLFFTA